MQPQSPVRLVDLLGLCIIREKSDLTTLQRAENRQYLFLSWWVLLPGSEAHREPSAGKAASVFKSIISENVSEIKHNLMGKKSQFFFHPVSMD